MPLQFGSLTFLYLFLPASLAVFNIAPKKLKSWALTAISAAFVALAQWKYFCGEYNFSVRNVGIYAKERRKR